MSKKNIIFINIPKTGSSAIRKLHGNGKVKTSVLGEFGPIGRHKIHYVAREYPDLASHYSFCFVRNPWDRIVSEYKWGTTRANYYCGIKSFDHFVDMVYSGEDRELFGDYKRHVIPQTSYILDAEGNKIVNFVGKFERLQVDYDKVLKALGKRRKILDRVNATSSSSYKSHYSSDETIKKVGDIYKSDVEYFKYTF